MSPRRKVQLAVSIPSVVLLIATVTMAALSAESTKPGPAAGETEASRDPIPPPDEQPVRHGPEAVSARATPPAGVSCARGWSYFDNPVMHYGLCVPPGWGFSDFSDPGAMDTIPGVELLSLHLLSPNAFPWVRGRLPFDAIATRAVLDVELDALPAGATASTECEPTTPVDTPYARVLTCEQPYTSDGVPASPGELRAIKVIVPLMRAPSDDPAGNLDGARLLMILRARATASAKEVETLWQIVRSVRAY